MSKLTRIIYYEVVGRGQFPIDMLRYDVAFPANPEAVTSISRERREAARMANKVTVRLGSYRRPTVARWNSFGWLVNE